MIIYLKMIPNQITAVRFLLVPILWILAVMRMPDYIGVGLIISFVSDAMDGLVARRLNQVTEFGAKFDSLADNILIPSAAVWLLMLKPAPFAEHSYISLLAISLYVLSLATGLYKFKQFGNLHLYLSKVSGAVQYAFIIHTFIAIEYSHWLFYLTISLFTLSSLETLLLQLICSNVNEKMGSALFLINNKKLCYLVLRFNKGLTNKLYLL